MYPGEIYHITSRGNNRQLIFDDHQHYLRFLYKVRQSLTAHSDILCYCLMPNHFHLMVKIKDAENVESAFKNKYSTLLSSYAQWLGRKRRVTGTIFKKRSVFKKIEDPVYAFRCFIYIHQNPIRARLVNKLEDWEYSSYPDYAGLRSGTLCDRTLSTELLELPRDPSSFRKISYNTIDEEYVKYFRA